MYSRSTYVSSASAYRYLLIWHAGQSARLCPRALLCPSQAAERNPSTRFATGGGDERVAFKFRARHAHRLTVTRQVADRQRRDCRRRIIGCPVRSSKSAGRGFRSSGPRSPDPAAGMSPINAQQGAGPCHAPRHGRHPHQPSGRSLLLKPGEARRDVSTLYSQQHAPISTSRPAQLSRVSK